MSSWKSLPWKRHPDAFFIALIVGIAATPFTGGIAAGVMLFIIEPMFEDFFRDQDALVGASASADGYFIWGVVIADILVILYWWRKALQKDLYSLQK